MDDLEPILDRDLGVDEVDESSEPDSASDWDLLLGFRSRGDKTHLERLFLRHRDSLFSFALRMLRNRQDAEDVTIEAFFKMSTRPTVEAKGSFRAFAFTVVRHLCLDRLRRRTVRTRANVLLFNSQERAPGPDELLSLSQELGALDRAVGLLRPRHREVLLLYYTHGLNSIEVGEVLGISSQQVRSQLSYARRLLREILEQEGLR